MANAYTIKATPEATDSITISDVTGAIFKATLGSLPGTSSAVGGYVDPPVYSDSSGIKGQYSFDEEYVYMCIADNSWDRFPVAWDAWGAAMPEYPAILSKTIDESGGVFTLVFDRPMFQGAAYSDADFNLDASISGTDIGLAYVSGDGTDTWVLSIEEIIMKDDVVNLDYLGRVDGVEDSMGNDLGVVLNGGVTNGSTAGADCTSSVQVFLTYDDSGYKKIVFDQSNGTAYTAYSRELRRKLAGSEEFCLVGELPEGYYFTGITIDQSTGVLYAVGFDAENVGQIFTYGEETGVFTESGEPIPSDYWFVEAICVYDGSIYVGGNNGSELGCVFTRTISGSTWSVFYSGYTEHPSIEGIYCYDLYVDAQGVIYITWSHASYTPTTVYGSIVTKYNGTTFSDILSFEDRTVSGLNVVATRRHGDMSHFMMYDISESGYVAGMALYSQAADGGVITRLDYVIDNLTDGRDVYGGSMYLIENYEAFYAEPAVEKSALLEYPLDV